MSYPFLPSKNEKNGNDGDDERGNITTEEVDEGSSILRSPSDKDDDDDDSYKLADIYTSRRSSLRTPKKQEIDMIPSKHVIQKAQLPVLQISQNKIDDNNHNDDQNSNEAENNSDDSSRPNTPISKNISTTNTPGADMQNQIVRTPSRRSSTPNSKTSTPGRSNSRGSTPRKPTTPLILEAMEDAATPRRNRLLLTPTRNKSKSRYSPKDDLMMLGKLLFAEKTDKPHKKRKLDSPKTRDVLPDEPLNKLYNFVTSNKETTEQELQSKAEKENEYLENENNVDITITSTENAKSSQRNAADILRERDKILESSISIEEHNDFNDGVLNEINTNDNSEVSDLSELDSDHSVSPSRSIVSSRLSIATSIANDSNVAIPEAIIREEGAYGRDLSDDQEVENDGHTSLSDFSFGNDDVGFDIDSSSRNDIDDDTVDFDPDLSLLNDVRIERPERLSFIPIKRSEGSVKNSQENMEKVTVNSIGAPIIKNICKVLLPTIASKKLKSRKTLDVLDKISREFFEQEINDLEAYAKHDKRKRITAEDVKLLMHRSNLTVTTDLMDLQSNSVESEILRLGSQAYDMEDFRVLERILFSKQISKVSRERKKRERKLKEEQRKKEYHVNKDNNNSIHAADSGEDVADEGTWVENANLNNEIRTQDLDNLKSSIDIEIGGDFIDYEGMPEIPLAEDEDEEE